MGFTRMATETPRFNLYQSVVTEAEKHTLLGLQGELVTTDATIELVLAALAAFEGGLTRDDLITALIEGEAQGVTLYTNLQSRNDPEYWRAVRQEAEAFWAKR